MKVGELAQILFNLPQDARIEQMDGTELDLVCVNRKQKRVSFSPEDDRVERLAWGWEYVSLKK